jgi:hypothetical protein
MKRLDPCCIPKVHDHYTTITQSNVVHVTSTIRARSWKENGNWRVKKFAHLSPLVANDVGILYFDTISNIPILMTFLMPLP